MNFDAPLVTSLRYRRRIENENTKEEKAMTEIEEQKMYKDIFSIQNLAEISKTTPTELITAYKTGGLPQFEATFRKILLQNVPDLCSPSLNPDTEEEYHKLEVKVFRLFEQFICDTENPEQVIESLKNNEVPSSFCGHVFKGGEPTYSCRACAMDPTCVFCGPCFWRSGHKEHEYTVSSSSGGGYCDCGDPEAWTNEPWCTHHAQLRDQKLDPSESANLPDEMEARCEILIPHLFRHAVRFMASTPTALEEKWVNDQSAKRFVVVLHNNEVNTYDEVIRTLERCLKVGRQEATDFATIVDRIGKSNVWLGKQRKEANKIAEEIAKYIRDINVSGVALKCDAVPTDVAAFASFGVYCMRWLRSLADRLVGLRHAVCQSVFQPDTGMAAVMGRENHALQRADSWLEFLILSDSYLWKFARNEIHEFYLTVLFKEAEWKKEFAIMYTRNYMTVATCYAENDFYMEESIVMMSVQLFTVISLAHYLLEHENVLVRLLEPLLELLSGLPQYTKASGTFTVFPPEPVRLQEASRQRFPPWKRLAQNLHDLEYVLRCPSPESWNNQLRDNFVAGVDSLLRLLAFIQDMDASKRQVEYHVELEIEWEYGVKLYLQLYNAITMVTRWAATDAQLFARVCELVAHRTHQYVFDKDVAHMVRRPLEGQKPLSSVLCDFDDSCSIFKVSEEAISLHQPFVRLFTALIVSYSQAAGTLIDPLQYMQSSTPLWVLMERPLRCLVWSSQVLANMWRRNGYAMVSMNFFYRSNRFARERLDRDLQLLQFCASKMEPDVFLCHMMRAFGVLDWWRRKEKPIGRDEVKTFYKIMEEFLLILIYVVSERCQVGVGGNVSEDDVYRNEIIHLLSRGPYSHSDIIKDMSDHEATRTENIFERLISDVANTRQKVSSTTCSVQFVLKREYYKHYNPFYYHFYNTDRTQAIEAHRRRLKEESDGVQFVALRPPRPLRLSAVFSGLGNLLPSRAFIVLSHHIISEAVTSGNRASSNMSDNMVERILHLIAVGLLDDKYNSESRFPFVRALRGDTFPGKDVVTCLHSLSDCMDREDLKTLLHWVLKKISSLERAIQSQMEVCESVTSGHEPIDVDGRGAEEGTPTNSSEDNTMSGDDDASSTPAEPESSEPTRLSAADKQKQDAMRRRQRLMAKMSAMQKKFVKENEQLMNEANLSSSTLESETEAGRVDAFAEGALLQRDVVIGTGRLIAESVRKKKEEQYRCILCQEDSSATTGNRCIVVTGFVMRSTVLRRDHNIIQNTVVEERKKKNAMGGNPLTSSPLPKECFLSDQPHFASIWLPNGVYFSSCGHHMHSDCWNKCFEAHQRRQQRRTRLMHPPQHDFPCPLCNKPCNTVMPVAPELNALQATRRLHEVLSSSMTYLEWLKSVTLAQRAAHMAIEGHKKSKPQVLTLTPSLASLDGVSTNVRKMYTSHYARPIEPSDRPLADYKRMLDKFARDNFESWKGRGQADSQSLSMTDERVVILLRRTTAYTLASLEQYLRYCNEIEESPTGATASSITAPSGKGTALFGGLPSTRQWESTRALVRLACIAQGQLTEAEHSQRLRASAFTLLRPLLPLEEDEHYNASAPGLLQIDVFDLLISLVLTSPLQFLGSSDFRLETVPIGSAVEHCLLRLCYTAHIFQTIMKPAVGGERSGEAMEVERRPVNSLDEELAGVTPRLAELASLVRRRAGLGDVAEIRTDEEWRMHLRTAVTPFLRCCALFFNCVTGVPPPDTLTADGWSLERQFESLCAYLDLETDFVSHLCCRSPEATEEPSSSLFILDWWCRRENEKLVQLGSTVSFVHYPIPLNTLVRLPEHYTEVLGLAVHFKCPTYSTSSDEFRPAALCLICGKIICWGIYCCQTDIDSQLVGVLPLHLSVCGSGDADVDIGMVDRSSPRRRTPRIPPNMHGSGMMLRMRESQVLMLSYGGTKASPFVSPYVDRYGENDIGLNRGNPLHLDQKLYQRLNRIWLLHGIIDEIESGIRQRGGTHQWFDFS